MWVASGSSPENRPPMLPFLLAGKRQELEQPPWAHEQKVKDEDGSCATCSELLA